jgi:hypothetical protein
VKINKYLFLFLLVF